MNVPARGLVCNLEEPIQGSRCVCTLLQASIAHCGKLDADLFTIGGADLFSILFQKPESLQYSSTGSNRSLCQRIPAFPISL
jgi:hypothetical protein